MTGMVFDEMRRELKELLTLVRRDEQYCAAVMSGQVPATDQSAIEHTQRAVRITELTDRYGLR